MMDFGFIFIGKDVVYYISSTLNILYVLGWPDLKTKLL